MRCKTTLVLLLVLIAPTASGARRALLIGINDYSASRLRAPARHVPHGRDWTNLRGAVNDVEAMAEMLVLRYGFERQEIAVLTDQAATRAAILNALDEQLVRPAAKGDVVFFYYAGHGSQVRNSRSDEPDKLDETRVPADSRIGAADIRDKELRARFNRILDRGARLTVILDSCHSGSGARGLPTGEQPRGVKPDLRDIADATPAGPRPEDRGAVVITAAQDSDAAWETRDEQRKMRGAFSWAWLRAMRDAAAHEPVYETFLRAQARLRAETPYQEPVFAAPDSGARMAPFLGTGGERRREQNSVAVEKVRDGVVSLQGGWANGLTVGTRLRAVGDAASRLTITEIHGLGRSVARIDAGAKPESGALLEVIAWAPPPGRPLRVWMPVVTRDLRAFARKVRARATQRGLRWTEDPVAQTPAHVLRWSGSAWELLGAGVQRPASDEAALAAIAKLPRGTTLFVQFPAPAALAGVHAAPSAAEADYILAGRYRSQRLEYALLRPLAKASDRGRSSMPLRTAWSANLQTQREHALRLRQIHAWYQLESAPAARFPYRLAIPGAENGVVVAGRTYGLVLQKTGAGTRVPRRYVYVFSVDTHGRSELLFPRGGSVENRFPLDPNAPPRSIQLGSDALFEVFPPYGADTWFLVTTDEPLPNPWVLTWEGVRAASRGVYGWSIERVVYESVPQTARRRVSKKD